jgi:hypothetical protein
VQALLLKQPLANLRKASILRPPKYSEPVPF